ncbi:CopG family transcriptional regulator [Paenibacillus alvei]|uniref:CopG family transcriptional regulator n=1 Tax=Paenibacillus alvei TaxID=44250 RepID=UPI0022814821|nr:CopG family transcriptional regulator [Paenibacillus alvei]MCY9757338.1 CopG family transcriptional regulator [Paenibacillus alvei]
MKAITKREVSLMREPGGYRPGSGRKYIGPNRRIYLALPEEVWAQIDKDGKSTDVIRKILIQHYSKKKGDS